MRSKTGVKGRVLKLFTAVFLLVMLCGMNVFAAQDKMVSMQSSNGGYVYKGQLGGHRAVYHKIKVNKPGALVVTGGYTNGSYRSGMKITLCNSKKKSLETSGIGSSINIWAHDVNRLKGFVCYGVKRGTYYIKVTGIPAADTYELGAAFEALSDKGGASKGKAATIKEDKEMSGVMCAGESASKADWFKFKVTKRKVLNLYFETAGTGKFTLYLYGPSFKKGIRVDSLKNDSGSYYTKRGGSRMKVATGTYYLKVVRASGASKKGCGVYWLKWKLS